MSITEKDIIQAYKDCATEEVQLMKLEEKRRDLDLKIQKCRANLVQYKDALHMLHMEISQPVFPSGDELLQTKVA